MQGRHWKHGAILAITTLVVCGNHVAFAQVAPPMGQAGSFAVLAGSGVTNTGATAVTGDVGVSPGTAITGFPPGTITGGAMHANDAFAQGAQSDLTTAYNALAGQACNTSLSGTDLGGLTLTAAVYCFTSSAQLTGTLTLDAQGDPNANFVFQIGSTLTTATDSDVVVINGGSDCNVFWQAGSSITLGTGTRFVGNSFALTSITLVTGASSHGALLARNGAVTLDTSPVAVCAPTTPVSLQSFMVD
jgi:type VI secretion system secreted protein VgrG